ncbi:hypothetical protein STRDD11_00223 [Streptococcus sp. DD11]|uniref:hypothetical protein n=1 Tax=Streptococcus sp. DD11 TaxID=1777879 RepID=UPI000795607E|nr:hypothetical protein [Streptococcus sp. DD11]KXT85770.1 hypothetical protein STRDD11_00223 [Streptococcus sp. DD11]
MPSIPGKGEKYKGNKLKLEDMSSQQLGEFTSAIGELKSDGIDALDTYFDKKNYLQ